MHLLVMYRAQQAAITYAGLTKIDPMSHMMRGAYPRWPIAARETASAVPGNKCAANTQGHSPHGPSDIQRLGLTTQHNGN